MLAPPDCSITNSNFTDNENVPCQQYHRIPATINSSMTENFRAQLSTGLNRPFGGYGDNQTIYKR